MEEKDAIEFVKKFVKEKLNDDINEFKNFNFEKIKTEEYGEMTSSGDFDADDTKIARAIYFLIWKDLLPELDKLDDIGTGKKYRGDHLNTFNTLFGRDYIGLNKYADDEELKKKAKGFNEKYQTIGNFMLLPNKSLTDKITLNTYRGTCSWHDYFDIFLSELEKCLNKYASNETLKALVECNSIYFQEINTIQKFRDVNYLEKYFENDAVKIFFNKCIFHWQKKEENLTEEDKQEYVKFAKNYIDIASLIIDDRAIKMISALNNKLYP